MLRAGEDCRWSSETAVSALSGVPLEAEQRPQRTIAASVRRPGQASAKERARARGAARAAPRAPLT
jgi:hypothetical protein